MVRCWFRTISPVRSIASRISPEWAARLAAAALVAAAVFCLSPARAQSIEAGARAAIACQACHGLDGLSKLPDAPHLAGQPEAYLVRALRAYRSGERRNEVMSVAAKGLSDDDIRNLAAYYSAIRIEVRPRTP
jgi:cytochrome c553